MLGRLLNTLSHRLEKEEAEWRSVNVVRQEMAYGYLRGALIRIAEHPVGWPLAALGISLIGSIGLWFLPGYWLPSFAPDLKAVDLIAYFSALWSIQAAVAPWFIRSSLHL